MPHIVTPFRSELEEARLQLSEGLLRLWEQADLVDQLFRNGDSTEGAKDLLREIQKTVNEMRHHINILIETSERRA
jgi:hypothetical protein